MSLNGRTTKLPYRDCCNQPLCLTNSKWKIETCILNFTWSNPWSCAFYKKNWLNYSNVRSRLFRLNEKVAVISIIIIIIVIMATRHKGNSVFYHWSLSGVVPSSRSMEVTSVICNSWSKISKSFMPLSISLYSHFGRVVRGVGKLLLCN